MKRYSVKFYMVSVQIFGDGIGEQIWFERFYYGHSEEEIFEEVTTKLYNLTFIENANGTHFYRTSAITDFSIEEAVEQPNLSQI